jgi:hypothetical protein
MGTAIMMRAGWETGATYYGHADFSMGYDVSIKMILGHFTFRSIAIVHRDQNVALIENIMPFGYRGGFNTDYITHREELHLTHKDRPSVIATALPINERPLPKLASFYGQLPYSQDYLLSSQRKHSYSTADFYNYVYQVEKLDNSSREFANRNYFTQAVGYNMFAFEGHLARYNKSKAIFNNWHPSKGHRGPNGSQPGAADVWNGAAKMFPEWNVMKHDNLD